MHKILRQEYQVQTPPPILSRTYWIVLIFIAAFALRFSLSWVNVQANDNHYEVIHKLLTNQPTKLENCWQCYHSKAFHYTGAGLIKLSGLESPQGQYRLLNLFNSLLGMGTLWLIWLFIRSQRFLNRYHIPIFALIALNPKFIYINSQLTNDSMVIFFSTLAIFGIYRLYQSPLQSKHKFFYLFIFVGGILAPLIKASGLAIFGGLALCLFVVSFKSTQPLSKKLISLGITSLFVILTLSASGFMGSYYDNYKSKGNFLATNSGTKSPPHLWVESHLNRAGISSISKGFFTFHPIRLLKLPYLIQISSEYDESRKSLWSQLYARYWSARYSNWPPSNYSRDPIILWNTRISLFLGYPFALLFLTGILISLIRIGRSFTPKRFWSFIKKGSWVIPAFGFGFFLVIIQLAFQYREYNFLKVIYILPALLPFVWFFMIGLYFWVKKLGSTSGFQKAFYTLTILSVSFATSEILFLTKDLSGSYLENAKVLNQYRIPSTYTEIGICLSDLTPLMSQQSWGKVEFNRATGGGPLLTNSIEYRCGLGVHAPSLVKYLLNKKYESLSIGFGLNDTGEKSSGVKFKVLADSLTLYRSEIFSAGQMKRIHLDVSDVDTLTLKVEDVGDINSDHANWIEPLLTSKNQDPE